MRNDDLLQEKASKFAALFFMFAAWLISAPAPAAPRSEAAAAFASTQKIGRLKVEYKNKLFSVDAEDVSVQRLIEEIEKQSGVSIALPDGDLRNKHVTVFWFGLNERDTLYRIVGAAGMGGFGYSLARKVSPEGKVEWHIEQAALLEKGGIESTRKKDAVKDGEALLLAAIDRHDKAVPKNTKYTVSRKEYQGDKETANFKYTIETGSLTNHFHVIEGNAPSKSIEAVRYNRIMYGLPRYMEKGEVVSNGKGTYSISKADVPFRAVLRINQETEVVSGYELYRDGKQIVRAVFIANDNTFSNIKVEVHDMVKNKIIKEEYSR